jgi:polygalacturonase
MNTLSKILSVCLLLVTTSELLAQGKTPVTSVTFKKDTFNILKYGAKPDGITLNTKSINDAVDACNKKGGGVVLIPEGLWLTAPIVIKSNVNLHLAANAFVLFTTDFDQYKLVEGNWEGHASYRNQSPVSATDAQNIGITGSGIIDGNGDAWRAIKKDKLTENQWNRLVASGGIVGQDQKTWYPSAKSMKGATTKNAGIISAGGSISDVDAIKDFLRPNLVVLTKCKNVLLEGVTFQNSPAWCLHPLMCENLTVRGVNVKNPWYAQNGDGIDVESCKGVLIENSVFDAGDDGICIKSGRDEEGRKRNMPTQDLVVRHCTVYHAHGGFVIGSEMSGGVKNVYVSDCTFIGTDVGLRFKTTRGRGGVVENINISNITMKNIVGEAILFDMYYMAKDPVAMVGEKREEPKVQTLPVTEATPIFRNFHISNITCSGAEKAIFVRGIPEMHIKDIVLENMVLQARKGIECSEASGIEFNNIKVLSDNTNPVVDVLNSDHIKFNKVTYKDGSDLLFRIGGERTSDISVNNTDVTKAKQKAQFEFGAKEQSLTINK